MANVYMQCFVDVCVAMRYQMINLNVRHMGLTRHYENESYSSYVYAYV